LCPLNEKWQRTRLAESELSNVENVHVRCIDTGEEHNVLIALIRTLRNMLGIEAEMMRDFPQLAIKYFLMNVIAAQSPE
jgi:hypothetical protein